MLFIYFDFIFYEDDLVHVDGENTSAAETEKIIFLWNNEVKNYVNWIE